MNIPEKLLYAAGVIPYVKNKSNEISFLLGYENDKWSGFIGKYEETIDNNNIINTAMREFNEETANVFDYHLENIRKKIVFSDSILVIANTKTRIVYIYFVRLDESLMKVPFEQMFQENIKEYSNQYFKEKSKIEWINHNDFRDYNILPSLKKVIFRNMERF